MGNKLPEIRKGVEYGFTSCALTIVDCLYVESTPDTGISAHWLLLGVREHGHTPYLVTTVNAQSWAFKEWTQGHYFTSLQKAMTKFEEIAKERYPGLSGHPS